MIDKLKKTVIDGGYCIGCGVCAAVEGSGMEIRLDNYGQLKAYVSTKSIDHTPSIDVCKVCPFSSDAIDEDTIAKPLFSEHCNYHAQIGYYLKNSAGYVSKEPFRVNGSSGGMVSWIAASLLENQMVDGVLHIHPCTPSQNDPRLFRYQISTSVSEVIEGAKSKYYPIELSEVLKLVRAKPGRYAVIGIPCFIKAIRLLAKQDSVISERIIFCIGLVCGHLKSTRFADLLAWQCGIKPGKLASIDFRYKLRNTFANQYGVAVTGDVNGSIIHACKPSDELLGTNWGVGYFKYNACDYCDDVFAETADITLGDAWLPEYISDPQGTNIVVVRNPIIKDLISLGIARGDLKLKEMSTDDIALSQAGGLRHRRNGLAYRLYCTARQKKWHPPCRVIPDAANWNIKLRIQQWLRTKSAPLTNIAFDESVTKDDLSIFVNKMKRVEKSYMAFYYFCRCLNLPGKIIYGLKKLLH